MKMTATPEPTLTNKASPFFSMGFRPFFLLGSLWAAIAVPLWVATYLLGPAEIPFETGIAWHAHEMIFGYGAAIIAGFLLTAVPNWTGRPPIAGAMLAGLVALWVAGRIALISKLGPSWFGASIDAAFLICFAALIWREVIAGKSTRNLKVAGAVSVLAAANVGFHIAQNGQPLMPQTVLHIGMAVILILIILIGGRVTPNFTRNWLKQRGAKLPVIYGNFDAVVLILSVLAIAAWVISPNHLSSGMVMIFVGVMNFARLVRWRFWATFVEPLVLILHVGYAWASLAFLLLGLSVLDPLAFPRLAGIHALGTGAIGVMTLAMMTRATLGHSGRALSAGAGTILIYLLINGAAFLRVATPFLDASLQPSITVVSAVVWSLAFMSFVVVYGPLLVRSKR